MIAAKEFTSAAEILAHASAVRKRLFNARKKVAIVTPTNNDVKNAVVQLKPKPSKPRKLPLWQASPCMFEEHVIAFRVEKVLQERQANGEIEIVIDRRRTVSSVVAEVLKAYPEFTIADLRSARRTTNLARVRQLAMYEVRRQRPDMSHPAIGRWFGGRDHTTVLHALKQVAARKATGTQLG